MVRSMQGKEVDMEKLIRQHELMPAVGNVRVNARGDELGPGGQIVRKREDIVAEYYESKLNQLKQKQMLQLKQKQMLQLKKKLKSNLQRGLNESTRKNCSVKEQCVSV